MREQSGWRPAVPAGHLVYAVGDSHGCLNKLQLLHVAIRDDAEARAAGITRKVVVYLGDYVDRGPDSRGLISLLIEQPLEGFEAVHLMGNHDAFMIDFLAGRGDLDLWMMNGAATTLESYGLEVPRWGLFGTASGELRSTLYDRLPESHRRFLAGLKLSHTEGDYFFCHAGIRPGRALEDQQREDLLWIRDPFLYSRDDHGKVIVHGHTPTSAPEHHGNRIGIDSGAVYGGPLTALVLEGAAAPRFLQA